MSVAHGNSAGPAASCGSGTRTLTSTRHAGVSSQQRGKSWCLYLCVVLFLLCLPLFHSWRKENTSTNWKISWILFHSPSSIFLSDSSCILLTPWSSVLPETLSSPHLLKKFPAFYATRRSITVFTRPRHLSLSWARSIQSMPPIPPLKDPF